MSAHSPNSPQFPYDKSPSRRKDRPPALDILDSSAPSSHFLDRHPSPDDTMSHAEQVIGHSLHLVLTPLTIFQLHADQSIDDLHAHLPSRSTSATSSLDPYYFSVHSPSGSPVPPLPDPPQLRSTPETRQVTHDPVTPHRDPSKIDRRILHGLGELATPRWTRSVTHREDDIHGLDQDDLEPPLPEEPEDIDSDSPWTIEAVDGEDDDEERDQVYLSFRCSPIQLSNGASISLLNLNRSHGRFVLDLPSPRRAVVKRSSIRVPSSDLLSRPLPRLIAPLRSIPCRLSPSPHRRAKQRSVHPMSLNGTWRARSSEIISGLLPALSLMTPRRNVLPPGNITALVWECLHEISHESVEKIVCRLVGAELGIVTLDTPRQVLLPQVTANSFIPVVFIPLTSLTSPRLLQQRQSSSSCVTRAAMAPSALLLLLALRRRRTPNPTTHQMWHTHYSGGLRRGGPISMIKPLLRRCASSTDSRVNQAPACVPVWVAFDLSALVDLEHPQSRRSNGRA